MLVAADPAQKQASSTSDAISKGYAAAAASNVVGSWQCKGCPECTEAPLSSLPKKQSRNIGIGDCRGPHRMRLQGPAPHANQPNNNGMRTLLQKKARLLAHTRAQNYAAATACRTKRSTQSRNQQRQQAAEGCCRRCWCVLSHPTEQGLDTDLPRMQCNEFVVYACSS